MGRVEELKWFEKYFKSKGFDMYLQFGTLVGCVREGKVVANDHDIDVCYMSKRHYAKDVYKEARVLANILADDDLLKAYFEPVEGTHYGNKHIVKDGLSYDAVLSGQFHIGKDYLFDLFTSWIDERGNYWTCQWGNYGNVSVLPFKQGKLERFKFNIPNDYNNILTRLYGDWTVPADDHPSKLLHRSFYLNKQANG